MPTPNRRSHSPAAAPPTAMCHPAPTITCCPAVPPYSAVGRAARPPALPLGPPQSRAEGFCYPSNCNPFALRRSTVSVCHLAALATHPTAIVQYVHRPAPYSMRIAAQCPGWDAAGPGGAAHLGNPPPLTGPLTRTTLSLHLKCLQRISMRATLCPHLECLTAHSFAVLPGSVHWWPMWHSCAMTN